MMLFLIRVALLIFIINKSGLSVCVALSSVYYKKHNKFMKSKRIIIIDSAMSTNSMCQSVLFILWNRFNISSIADLRKLQNTFCIKEDNNKLVPL
jgi:uncharacterized protein YbbC (DUF1343 family)